MFIDESEQNRVVAIARAGARLNEFPFTPEKVLQAIQAVKR